MHSQQVLATLQLGTIEANRLENFFDFVDVTNVENWLCQFHVSKVARTLGHASCTRGTPKIAIVGAKPQVKQSSWLGKTIGIIGLGEVN